MKYTCRIASTRCSRTENFNEYSCRAEASKHSIFHLTVSRWNELPTNTRMCDSSYQNWQSSYFSSLFFLFLFRCPDNTQCSTDPRHLQHLLSCRWCVHTQAHLSLLTTAISRIAPVFAPWQYGMRSFLAHILNEMCSPLLPEVSAQTGSNWKKKKDICGMLCGCICCSWLIYCVRALYLCSIYEVC